MGEEEARVGSGAVGVPVDGTGLAGGGFGLTGGVGAVSGLGSMSAGARGTMSSGSIFLKGQPTERCLAWRSEVVVAAGD